MTRIFWAVLALLLAASVHAESDMSQSGTGPGTSIQTSTLTVSGPITASSATFVGLELSTQAAGGAGAAVTATCRTAGTFVVGGGCSCAGAVAETANISVPSSVAAGGLATGWTCQVSGGTGGVCSAYVFCSRLQ